MTSKKVEPPIEISRREGTSLHDPTDDHYYGRQIQYGLPTSINRFPAFECGCTTAYFAAIISANGGQVEAEYRCEFDISVFATFLVHEKKKRTPRKDKILVDKYGNTTTSEGFKATELEEL